MLRATKAFNHLFPVEKEKDLAKVVAYEKYCLLFFLNNYSVLLNNNLHIHLLISTNFHYRYDPNRIIAYQGRKPERFYYVLTGKGKRIVKRKKQLSYIDR